MRQRNFKCCICGKETEGVGYNPSSFYGDKKDDRCCRKCRWKYVIPVLIAEKVYMEKCYG